MKLSTLMGAASVLAMLLLSSPGVRITRVDPPAAAPAAAAPAAGATR
jgi:hypothetical protein